MSISSDLSKAVNNGIVTMVIKTISGFEGDTSQERAVLMS